MRTIYGGKLSLRTILAHRRGLLSTGTREAFVEIEKATVPKNATQLYALGCNTQSCVAFLNSVSTYEMNNSSPSTHITKAFGVYNYIFSYF